MAYEPVTSIGRAYIHGTLIMNTQIKSSVAVSKCSKFLIKHKWAHPTWIDISDFLKYVYSVSRGEQHRLCRDVVNDYHDNWFDIVAHNSGKHVNKLLDLFKRVNIEHNFHRVTRDDRDKKFGKHGNLHAQALEDIFKLPGVINSTFNNAGKIFKNIDDIRLVDKTFEAASHLDDTVVKVDKLVDQFNSQLAKILLVIQTKLDSLSWLKTSVCSWMPTIILFLSKVVSMGYLLSQPCNQNFQNVLAIVTLALPTIVVGNLEFISSLIRAIKGVMGKLVAQGEYDDCFILSFFKLTKDILSGLFTDVDKKTFDEMFISSKKIKMVADYVRSATTIIDLFMRLIEKLISIVGNMILQHYGVMPWFLKEDRIAPLIDRFIAMKEQKIDIMCKTHKHAAQTVNALYLDVMRMEATMVRSRETIKDHGVKIMPYIRVMVRTLEQLIAQIPLHLLSGKDMRRTKPFWVYIYGAPRVGKSAMFQPYLINKLVKELGIRQEYEDYTNYTYFRNCGEKYWEKYSNHPVLWYNDIFQNYTDEEAMQAAIMELTNVVDDSLYALNMAFEDKHGVYFNSELVISNSQLDIHGQNFVTSKCLSQGEHIFARRNVVVDFVLNDIYQNEDGVGIDYVKVNTAILLGDNVGYKTPLFPKDMYFLDFYDPVKNFKIMRCHFNEGVDYIVQVAKAYRDSQEVFKDQLYDHFREMWAQAGDLEIIEPLDFVDATSNIDTTQIFKYFEHAVSQLAPQFMDDFWISSVQQAYYDQDSDVVYAMDNFILHANDSNEVRRVNISVIVEVCSARSWLSNTSKGYYEKFKQSFKSIWSSFKTGIIMFVNDHPHLSWLLCMITYYIVICSFMGTFNIFEAQTGEGDKKEKHKQVVRVRKNQVIGKAQSYDEQNVVIENRIKSQMCKFVTVVKKNGEVVDTRVYGSGLCVGSDIFMLPAHFWYRWVEMREFYKTHNVDVELILMWSANQKVMIPWNVIEVFKPDYQHLEDVIFLRFKKLIQLKHLEKFFINVSDSPTLFDSYIYGLRGHDFGVSTISVSNVQLATKITYTHEARIEPLYQGHFNERVIYIPKCYRYNNCFTMGGDCGMLLFHTDSRTNCRKILGIHTAGNTSTGLGITSAVYQEDIHEAFEYFYPVETPIYIDGYDDLIITDTIAQSDEYQNLIKVGVPVLGFKRSYNNDRFEINKDFKLTLPRKTKIMKSVVHDMMVDDLGDSTVAPARLRPFVDTNGHFVSPFFLGLKKIAVTSDMVDVNEINAVVDHMYESIISWNSPYKEMRILTDDEMVNGYGCVKPMDMTTSPGFPYIVIDNTAGKHPYFNKISDHPKRFSMKEFVQCELEDRERLARDCVVKETYFIDTLKDEVRSIEKVESGKTRIFQVAPMDLNMLIRKYFGTFIAHCQRTYLEGEMAVGINATSKEWTFMIDKLLVNSDLFINGDGKNFDASLGQQYMMYIVDVINRIYDDGPINANIRKTIFATILNSHHLVGNLVYYSKQGNKSGITLTTIFNNLAGMFAIRLAFLRYTQNIHNFDLYIVCKFYGDDDLISVNSLINVGEKVLFDSKYYQSVWASLGVEYTSASKDNILLSYYTLSEISFLQRGFVRDMIYNVYLPQLNYTTILEIPRWSESDPYNVDDQMNRFNASLIEMSNYGEEKFNWLRSLYLNYCSLMVNMGFSLRLTALFNYNYCKRIIFPDIYGKDFLIKEQCDPLYEPNKFIQSLLFRGSSSE
jgi:hypothetical protein